MKKFSKFLAPVLGLALLAGGLLMASQGNDLQRVKAEETVTKFIPVCKENFRANGFNGFLGDDNFGNSNFDRAIKNRFDTFWAGRLYNSQSNIIDTIHGADGEGNTGGINSIDFKYNGGPYITFLMGGNSSNKVNIFDATKGYDVYYDIHPVFKDSELSINMQFKYFKLPEELKGDMMRIYIEDNTTSGFGGLTFADLQVNLTYEEMGKAFSAHKANLSRVACTEGVSNLDVRSYCLELYTNFNGTNVKDSISLTNAAYNYSYRPVKDGAVTTKTLENYYSEAIAAENSIQNLDEGFEVQNNMMWWAYDQTYEADINHGDFRLDTASSDASNHWNNNDLPFNKTGNRFFKGFHENGTGFIGGDGSKYRFLSSTFTLKGSGYISVKMAGHTARVTILNGDSTSANYLNELRSINVQTYNETGDASNVLKSGFNTVTMVRHIINLKDYLNQKLIIAIEDTGNASWGAVNFDEIITYYENNPQFKVDVTKQFDYKPFYVDVYCGVENDETDMAKAAAFLTSYYSTARARGDAGATYCYLNNTALSNLNTAYGNLSDGVKAIVDAAMDIDYGANDTWESGWYANTPTLRTVGLSMANIANRFNGSNSQNLFVKTINSSNAIFVIIALTTAIICAGTFFILKKKKHNK